MEQPAATAFAMRAFGLAQTFSLFVGSPPLVATDGRPMPIELTTPHGPSTGGGTQHLQHITLAYADRTIVVGSFDQLTGVFELRTFEYLGLRYQALPLPRPGYDELLRRLQVLGASQHLRIAIKDPPVAPAAVSPRAPAPAAPMRWLVPLVIGLALGAGAVLAVVYLR